MCGFILCGIWHVPRASLVSRLVYLIGPMKFIWRAGNIHIGNFIWITTQFKTNTKPFHCQKRKRIERHYCHRTMSWNVRFESFAFSLWFELVGWRCHHMDINGENYTARNCFFNSFVVDLHSHLHEAKIHMDATIIHVVVQSLRSNCLSFNANAARPGDIMTTKRVCHYVRRKTLKWSLSN